MSDIIRAISIRQPYAELILSGKRHVEYRGYKTNIRERVYLYASLTEDRNDIYDLIDEDKIPLPKGYIIGTVEILECKPLPYSTHCYEWCLGNARRFDKYLKPVNHPLPGIWRPEF